MSWAVVNLVTHPPEPESQHLFSMWVPAGSDGLAQGCGPCVFVGYRCPLTIVPHGLLPHHAPSTVLPQAAIANYDSLGGSNNKLISWPWRPETRDQGVGRPVLLKPLRLACRWLSVPVCVCWSLSIQVPVGPLSRPPCLQMSHSEVCVFVCVGGLQLQRMTSGGHGSALTDPASPWWPGPITPAAKQLLPLVGSVA